MQIMQSICHSCKWFDPAKELPNTINVFDGLDKCKAFPNGIPDEIITGGFDHRNQYSDETVLFELDDKEDSHRDLASWENHHRFLLEIMTIADK